MKVRKWYSGIWFLVVGIVIGLYAAWGTSYLRNLQKDVEGDPDAGEMNVMETKVDYPFHDSLEGWSLVLCEMGEGSMRSGREFRLYDAGGSLVQVLPCRIEEGEITFRFDQLFHYNGYNKDLVLFPAGAKNTGATGFCYPWDEREERFLEEPITVPWYQKSDVYNDNSFVISRTVGNVKINTICRINEESRQVVELRKWTLTADEAEDGENSRETLHIWDCLEQKDIYFGYVERDALGNLVNDKYYQFLFWDDLWYFRQWEDGHGISFWNRDEGKEVVYADRGELLEDCGFAGKKSFYEYYDPFHNLTLELYFDAKAGRGCGIFYDYNYNYVLEKVKRCWGFFFDAVKKDKWVNDTFSTLSYDGKDARRNNVLGYREIYQYTNDGLLSSFEARGTIVDYGEGEPGEDSLLSMDYVYRDDGTLYYKHYSHHHILFGTANREQSDYYDKQGRVVYQNAYATSGSLGSFYIYTNDSTVPAYCLTLDMYGGTVDAVMTKISP